MTTCINILNGTVSTFAMRDSPALLAILSTRPIMYMFNVTIWQVSCNPIYLGGNYSSLRGLLAQCCPGRRYPSPWNIAPLSAYTDWSQETELGRLLAKVERHLPIEVQQLLFSYNPRIIQSLARCAQTIESHFPQPPSASSHTETARPWKNGLKDGNIGAMTTTVLGESCITELGSGAGEWHCVVSVSDIPVKGVQVSFGSYGLAALRVIYTDESMSPWLGGQSPWRWFKTIKGQLKDMSTVFEVYWQAYFACPRVSADDYWL